jgi:hypothetical protein
MYITGQAYSFYLETAAGAQQLCFNRHLDEYPEMSKLLCRYVYRSFQNCTSIGKRLLCL